MEHGGPQITSEISNHLAALILMLHKKMSLIISTASFPATSILTLFLPSKAYGKDQLDKETISNPNHCDSLHFTYLVDINSCHLVLCEWQDLLDQTGH